MSRYARSSERVEIIITFLAQRKWRKNNMVSVYDVSPRQLVENVAKELQKLDSMHMPDWAPYVKTGCHNERLPKRVDWWYVRAASVLRTIYTKGPIGVGKLRTKYGGKQDRGYDSERSKKAGGKHIRLMLQQLERSGFVKQEAKGVHKGRVVTPKGRSLMDRAAIALSKSAKKGE